MNDPQHCRRCGRPLDTGFQGTTCSACMMRIALAAPLGSTEGVGQPLQQKLDGILEERDRRFGEYDLLSEIAHGGMGVVWRARQRRVNRVVALKMLLLGQFASREAQARFQREVEAAASLRHPNIVPVHDAGEIDGQVFYTMDFIEGRTLSSLLQAGPLPARVAATYARLIAEAVAHAHGQGIVHRDLKPSNILIDPFDQPQVTDFGLARRMGDPNEITSSGQVAGSPNYTAPELVDGGVREAGPAGDIFSLGAILYECLAGRPPFLGENVTSTLLRVRDQDPVSLRLLNQRLPQDLETIAFKCLEKDPTRRYDSAAALADDLGNWLAGRPIRARPISALERGWRWCRRQPALAGALALAVGLGCLVLGGSWLAAFRIDQARRAEAAERGRAQASESRATASEQASREGLVRQFVEKGTELATRGDPMAAMPWFLAALRNERDPERAGLHWMRLSFALRQAPRLEQVWRHDGAVEDIALSPDARWAASASEDKTARVWEVESGASVTPPLTHTHPVRSVQFSADGRFLLTRATFREPAEISRPDRGAGQVSVWSLPEGRLLWRFDSTNSIPAAVLSPDGSKVAAACSDGFARVFRTGDGEVLRTLVHAGEVWDVCFSPDGSKMATSGRDMTARVWDAADGRLLRQFENVQRLESWSWKRFSKVAFSPNGQDVMEANWSRARVWKVSTGTNRFDFESEYDLTGASFSPDGLWAVTTSRNGEGRIWSATNGMMRTVFRLFDRHTSVLERFSGEFTPDGQTILVRSPYGARFFDVNSGLAIAPFPGGQAVARAILSGDGRKLLLACQDHTARVLSLVTADEGRPSMINGDVNSAARFAPDGRRVIVGSANGALGFWHVQAGMPQRKDFQIHPWDIWGLEVLDFSRDGGLLLVTANSGRSRVYDSATALPVTPFLTNTPARNQPGVILPDGGSVVLGGGDGGLTLWSVPAGELLRTQPAAHSLKVRMLAKSLDGRLVASAGADRTARIWRAEDLQPVGHPLLLSREASCVAFSPDGARLAASTLHGELKIWDLATHSVLQELKHAQTIDTFVFSPDGRYLLTDNADGCARLWRVETGELVRRVEAGSVAYRPVFSPDGSLFAVGGSDGAGLWETSTGLQLALFKPDGVFGFANGVDFSPDGRRILAAGTSARTWELAPESFSTEEWDRLVTGLTGISVGANGGMRQLEVDQAVSAWRTAKAEHPGAFVADDEENLNFLWKRAGDVSDLALWKSVVPLADRLVEQARRENAPQATNSDFSMLRWRLRQRAHAKYMGGDLAGAGGDDPAYAIPPRDARCSDRQIDLGHHYNRLLDIGLLDYGNDFPQFHPGWRNLGGVDFDVRGRILLAGDGSERRNEPVAARGIPVGQSCSKLHVLQAAEFEAADGTLAGRFILHYADGVRRELPIVYGQDARNFWTVKGEPADTPNARVVWEGRNLTADASGATIRLWKRTYDNPRPEVPIESIDIVSARAAPQPLVFAITTE